MKTIRTADATPVRRKVAARMNELQRNAIRVAGLLKAMSNPARLVGELERAVGLSQSSISQHLAVLRSEKVVSSRRVGQTVLYSLASEEVEALMSTLHAVFCREAAVPTSAASRVRTA